MFDLPLFIFMCVIVVAANVIAVPKLIAYSGIYLDTRAQKVSLISKLTKGILLSLLACAIGSYTAPRVGLSAPFLESIITLDHPLITLWSQLRPALVSSVYVLLGLILLQLTFVRRHIKTSCFFSTPLSVKILLEGVIEELIFRWGLMSIIIRILDVEFLDTNAAIILGIILAAACSSLSHVSDLSRFNFDRISTALLGVVLLNFWAALCYGWLFWKFGLMAAILCHMMVAWASDFAYKVRHFWSFQDGDGLANG